MKTKNVLKGVLPYKVYSALLTQIGTSTPTAIVLENTIGNIVWSRQGVGEYLGTLNGVFLPEKTIVFFGVFDSAFTAAQGRIITDITSFPNSLSVSTIDLDNNHSDEMLSKTSIEIRIYN